MAEKRVSVRLAAVGGRQVRQALEGIGTAGQRGMGRVRREIDAANKRLDRFGRQLQRTGRVAAAALGAAATAMVRSGLQVIDAQAKLAQSLGTTTASVQVLARAADLTGTQWERLEGGATRLTRRLSLFAADGSGPAAGAIERLGLNAERLLALPLDQRIIEVTEAIRAQSSAAAQAANFSELFGDRAFTAFQRLDPEVIRLARDDLARFGALVSEIEADQIERTNDALTRLGLVWRGLSNQLAVALAPALERTAGFMTRLAETSGPLGRAIDWLGRNFERVAAYAGAFASVIGARLLGRVAAFALGLRGAATALVALRRVLVRLPFIGLVVAATELALQFPRLVRGAGSFGEAMTLLGDLAGKVWEGIGTGASALGPALKAVWTRIQAGFAAMIASLQRRWAGFLRDMAGAAGSIPGIGDRLQESLHVAGVRAQSRSYETDLAAGALRGKAAAQRAEAGRRLVAGGAEIAAAWERLRATVAAGATAAEGGLDGAAKAARTLRDAIDQAGGLGTGDGRKGGTGGPLGKLGEAARATGAAMSQAAGESKQSWQEAMREIGRQAERQRATARRLAEDITGPLKSALASGELSWRSFSDAISQIAQSLATRLINLAFKPIENALLSAFSGGGAGGGGGGFLANLFGFARGGVFDRAGEVHAFARGGVVDRPTLFPMARGVGLMGEAGPEAVMPLRRGRGGRLGVEAGGAVRESPMRIVNVLDPSVVGDYLATPSGERAILNVIRRNRSALNA
ncbi:phage tail tape measure protein [Roseovarius sp. E0-M6]|uniref:phage tail tape measure protein n=1 Tax=Roseovarius sp. E0-M6 TaxID=3127118 RepID=UPI00300F9FA4